MLPRASTTAKDCNLEGGTMEITQPGNKEKEE